MMLDLKELRKNANRMSQTRLCELAGVNRSTVSLIENGAIVPSVKVAKKLASVFGVDWRGFYDN